MLIVGSGISGISAIKAFLEEGQTPICYEADEDIGGLWRYKEDSEFPSIYKKTRINSWRAVNTYGDHPINGDEYSLMLHHSDLIQYLQDNVKTYGLKGYISFNQVVDFITPYKKTHEDGAGRLSLTHARKM